MNRLLLSVLILLLPACAAAQKHAWETDPVESKVGIHVIPNFGDDPTVYSPIITEDSVRSALRSVDWDSGFHQVVVVLSPGTSMEVGGSLDPRHGLAAVYRNRSEMAEAVTKQAPETVDDMEAILVAFLKPGDGWMRVQEFEFSGRR
ncbi:hypothetical protein QLQ15_14375 [Lysobacter sp. LF1]|uniref:DUF695 domain-containing protein n=1 Tax=Lysobacter stagni TaxID=3045172 RepID=A0ABT6XIV8_9GAMM|nr:hypothetical protein [Lysobacter sp. LF1]MDI9240097.1 hypothetical protein [Lysobacter sp. LF1]